MSSSRMRMQDGRPTMLGCGIEPRSGITSGTPVPLARSPDQCQYPRQRLRLQCDSMSFVDQPDVLTARERIPTTVCADPHEVSRTVAAEIAALIRLKQSRNEACVLGLATGSTP